MRAADPLYLENDHEAEALRAEDRWRRRHRAQLLEHPDCRDPDHPGCDSCQDKEEPTP